MKKVLVLGLLVLFSFGLFSYHAEARARYGSIRIGGYTSSGKGSHYVGGYVRTTHTLNYYLNH
jgi:hypothetical protein